MKIIIKILLNLLLSYEIMHLQEKKNLDIHMKKND